jgi:hypothetical protein
VGIRGFVGSVRFAFSCYQSFLNTHLAPAFDAFLFTRLIAVVPVGECLVVSFERLIMSAHLSVATMVVSLVGSDVYAPCSECHGTSLE